MATKTFMRYGARVARADGRPYLLFDLPGEVLIAYLAKRPGDLAYSVEFVLYSDHGFTSKRVDCGLVAAADLHSGRALRSDGNLSLPGAVVLEGAELPRLLAFLDEHDPAPPSVEPGQRERLSSLAV